MGRTFPFTTAVLVHFGESWCNWCKVEIFTNTKELNTSLIFYSHTYLIMTEARSKRGFFTVNFYRAVKCKKKKQQPILLRLLKLDKSTPLVQKTRKVRYH